MKIKMNKKAYFSGILNQLEKCAETPNIKVTPEQQKELIRQGIKMLGLATLLPTLAGGTYGFLKSKKGKGLHGLASGALRGNLGVLGGLLGGTGGAIAGLPGSMAVNDVTPFMLTGMAGTGAGAYGGTKLSDILYNMMLGEKAEDIYGE